MVGCSVGNAVCGDSNAHFQRKCAKLYMKPEEIIDAACKAIERNYGYQVRCVDFQIKMIGSNEAALIEIAFKYAHHQISCAPDKFVDPEQAYTLPFVSNFISRETFDRLTDNNKIIICFAA